jgi:CRAL/TRIO domain
MQSWIASELPKQHIVVLGKDNSSRPTVRPSSRQKNDDADNNTFQMDAFILTRIYMVERAAATVEYISQGERDTFNVVFRCDDYDRAFAPPFTAIQSMIQVLQQNYPERLHQFVALDPPFWIRTIYSLLKYLVASDSAKKIFLITMYDIQNGSAGISSSLSDEVLFGHIDTTYYLWNVPFYCPYEEELLSLEKPM